MFDELGAAVVAQEGLVAEEEQGGDGFAFADAILQFFVGDARHTRFYWEKNEGKRLLPLRQWVTFWVPALIRQMSLRQVIRHLLRGWPRTWEAPLRWRIGSR